MTYSFTLSVITEESMYDTNTETVKGFQFYGMHHFRFLCRLRYSEPNFVQPQNGVLISTLLGCYEGIE